jgi:hypothetical protein
MKAKLKDKPLNSILGVNIGLPSLSDTGVAVMNAENVIAAYEKEAREILKHDGYPLTIEELWNKKDELLPDLANGKGLAQVYSIFWMLWNLNSVRTYIEKNNSDMAVCYMAVAVHWAIRAQLKPIAHLIDISEKVVDGGKDGGTKSGKSRQEKAKPIKDSWQAEAEKIWKKHPTWGKISVAKIIEEKIGNPFETIRKYIKKPLP